MAKLQLGKAPVSFKRTVETVNLIGNKDTLEIEFKYMTRKQYGELLDEADLEGVKEAKNKKAKEKSDDHYTSAVVTTDKRSVDFILKIANGWDLEDAFTPENIAQLVDQFPAVTDEIAAAYRVAILEGRLKN